MTRIHTSQGHITSRKDRYRYLSVDAITNRVVFLMVLGLVVVFFVCIGSNGAVNNMEWIREGLVMTALSTSSHELEKRQISAVTNHIPDVSRVLYPFVIVMATGEIEGGIGLVNNMLEELTPIFVAHGLNTTGIMWITDSHAHAGETELCSHGQWRMHTMSLANASCMECLVNFLVNRMHVSVLYTRLQSENYRGTWPTIFTDWITARRTEDLIILPTTTDINPGEYHDLIPPVTSSFMRSDIFMVFNSPNSVSLFSDACMWSESSKTKMDQWSHRPEYFSTSGYALNIILNDGRPLHELDEQGGYDDFYVKNKNTDLVPLRYMIYPEQYLFWVPIGNITLTSDLGCRTVGVACCK